MIEASVWIHGGGGGSGIPGFSGESGIGKLQFVFHGLCILSKLGWFGLVEREREND